MVLVPDPQLEKLKENLFISLREAGKEYNQKGIIPFSILEKIEQPMLPNEVYIDIINSLVEK